jgi:hypothetical protein
LGQQLGRQAVKIELLAKTRRDRFDRLRRVDLAAAATPRWPNDADVGEAGAS